MFIAIDIYCPEARILECDSGFLGRVCLKVVNFSIVINKQRCIQKVF